MTPRAEVDVVVIGGGATGAGVLRDLAMRGLRATLVERGDFTSGTSGRYHGLLHSGARYVESDPISARHCIEENAVLRRIAPATIEPTGGYFVATPGRPRRLPRALPGRLRRGRHRGGAGARSTSCSAPSRSSAARSAPRTAFPTPRSSRGSWSTRTSPARASMAPRRIATTPVIGFERSADRAQSRPSACGTSAAARSGPSPAGRSSRPPAPGPARWRHSPARTLEMSPGKGSMLILNRRMTTAVVNRLAPPGDGDILVPVHTVCILGTTDITVPDPDDVHVTRDEVESPPRRWRAARARESRAPACCAPMPARGRSTTPHALDGRQPDESREISRAHHVIDHGARDGVGGLWSIVGGKLTTYRLMARDVVDRRGCVARRGRSVPHGRRAAAGARDRNAVLARRPARRAGGRWRRQRGARVRVRAGHPQPAGARPRRARRLVARRPAPHDAARDGAVPGRLLHAARGRRPRRAPTRAPRTPPLRGLRGRAIPRHAADRLGRPAGRAVAGGRDLPRHPRGRRPGHRARHRRPHRAPR